jgi:hypothetical protein
MARLVVLRPPGLPQPAMPASESGHLPPEATTPDTVDTDIRSGQTFRLIAFSTNIELARGDDRFSMPELIRSR